MLTERWQRVLVTLKHITANCNFNEQRPTDFVAAKLQFRTGKHRSRSKSCLLILQPIKSEGTQVMDTVSRNPSRNQHVVFVARNYWPMPCAATVRLQALTKEWKSRGAEVTVLTARNSKLTTRTIGPVGETVIPLHANIDTRYGIGSSLRLILFAVEAWWMMRKLRPTIVISDPPPTSGLAARFSSARVCTYYIADSWTEMLRGGDGKLTRFVARAVEPLERYVLRRAHLVIAVRENLAELARDSGSQNVLVVQYGTDLKAFNDQGPLWDDPWEGSKPYFVYAGNFGHMHGATIFFDAVEQLWKSGVHIGMVFIGYGSDQQRVDEFAKKNLTDFVSLPPSPPEVVAAINRGAMGALASLRPAEVSSQTRPAKALAALACGCPIVFAGKGAFASEVETQHLGVVPHWDAVAISEAMLSLLREFETDPGEYKRWRKQLVQYANTNFDMGQASKVLADRITALL